MRKWYYKLRQLWRYRTVIMNDVDFDWDGLMPIMEIKFTLMAKHHEKCKWIRNWKRVAKECRLAATLCKRIHKDDYGLELPDYRPPIGPWHRPNKDVDNKTIWWYSSYMIHQDEEYLFKLLAKRLRSWWD